MTKALFFSLRRDVDDRFEGSRHTTGIFDAEQKKPSSLVSKGGNVLGELLRLGPPWPGRSRAGRRAVGPAFEVELVRLHDPVSDETFERLLRDAIGVDGAAE
jgi:hypothetical protein